MKYGAEILIETKDFIITDFNAESYWLENKDGEGMQVWENDLNELLDKFFKENF